MLSVVGGPSEIEDIVCMSVGINGGTGGGDVAAGRSAVQRSEVQCSNGKCRCSGDVAMGVKRSDERVELGVKAKAGAGEARLDEGHRIPGASSQ